MNNSMHVDSCPKCGSGRVVMTQQNHKKSGLNSVTVSHSAQYRCGGENCGHKWIACIKPYKTIPAT